MCSSLEISGFKIANSKDDFLVADVNGRMLIDLLGVSDGSGSGDDASGSGSGLQAWLARADDPRGTVVGFSRPEPLQVRACRPARPQSHAFADFNGDGFADLLLTCQGQDGGHFLQLLTSAAEASSPSGGAAAAVRYEVAQEIRLPPGHGPISVADFNADGALDIAFAVCDPPADCSRRNEIHVLFNQQRPFCSRSGEQNCKKLGQMMEADESFGFTSESSAAAVVVDLNRVFGSDRYRVQTATPAGAPIHLAAGDFDVNGFLDLLVVVRDEVDGTNRVMLLENVPLQGRLRTFAHVTKGTAALQQISGATAAAFVNFYQDGPPDVVVNYNRDGSNRPSVQFVQNGFVQDAFFLRTETLNGVCPGPCMAVAQSTAPRPYGASFPGPTVKFSFTDFDGSLRIRLGAQLPQSGHNRLTAPFSFFGLGRTNNFVELLTVRTPARAQPNLASKAGLVPNSDLIINPPHADSPHNFHFELHILPAKYFLWVLMSIGSAMLVLGALTAYFKWREVREDQEERRKAIHSINFDAL